MPPKKFNTIKTCVKIKLITRKKIQNLDHICINVLKTN